MFTDRFNLLRSSIFVLILAAISLSAVAQETAPAAAAAESALAPPKDKKLNELWDDMIHYIKIAQENAALSWGQAILNYPDATPQDLYLLAINTPGSQAVLSRGSKLKGMEPIIAELNRRIELGYQADRSNPQRIANSIDMLGQNLRAFQIGSDRLVQSGEYALPQLIQKLGDPATPPLARERIITVLPRLGKQAVNGLSAALKIADPGLQEVFASALGQIGYFAAAPQLKELAETTRVERTRQVATSALVACAGKPAVGKPLAELYYDLAKRFYDHAESVVPDARIESANVWYFQDGLLAYKPVPRVIYCDVYAMRYARQALAHDSNFYPAVSLWLAANLRKANELPPGVTDPTVPADQPPAQFYALASSAAFMHDVLAMALKEKNSAMAMDAITALAKTEGAKNLVEPTSGGAQPLVEALTYPDKQVRFLAAITLANALPVKTFTGREMVVPVLNEALRQAGTKTAVVVIPDEAARNPIKDALRAAGYEIMDQPENTRAIAQAKQTLTADIAMVSEAQAGELVRGLRAEPAFAALPVLVIGDNESLRSLARADGKVVLLPSGTGADAVAKALVEAAAKGAGKPLTAEESAAWSIRAAEAIRMLGLTGNTVLEYARTIPALSEVLSDARPNVRLAAVGALAVMPTVGQQAIVPLAMNATAGDDVRIQAFASLSESIRRFGNQVTDPQAQSILELVNDVKAPMPLRQAAAQALGAMNLSSDKAKALILKTGQAD